MVICPAYVLSLENELICLASNRTGSQKCLNYRTGLEQSSECLSNRTDSHAMRPEEILSLDNITLCKTQDYAMTVLMEDFGRKVLQVDVCDRIEIF